MLVCRVADSENFGKGSVRRTLGNRLGTTLGARASLITESERGEDGKGKNKEEEVDGGGENLFCSPLFVFFFTFVRRLFINALVPRVTLDKSTKYLIKTRALQRCPMEAVDFHKSNTD